MKFFTKQRVFVLVSLIAVAMGLLTYIVVREYLNPAPISGGLNTITHEKVRDARVGLARHISWETNFGGSGDDIPADCYIVGDSIFVFGRTTSTDLDFDGNGGVFAAKLTTFGKTEKFVTFGNAGDDIMVALSNDGFIVAYGSGRAFSVDIISTDLESAPLAQLTNPEDVNYTLASITQQGDNLYIFRQSGGEVKHAVCDIVTTSSGKVIQKVFKQSLSLDFVCFYPVPALVAVFREKGTTVDCITFAEWTANGNISYSRIQTATPYQAFDVSPAPDGWSILASQGGQSCVIVVSASYSLVRTVYINFTGAQRGELFISAQTGELYASLYIEGEISGLYRLGSGITSASKVELPAYSNVEVYSTSTMLVLALTVSDTIHIATIDGSTIQTKEITSGGTHPRLMRTGSDWLIAFSATKNAAVIGNNYGGLDTCVAKIKF